MKNLASASGSKSYRDFIDNLLVRIHLIIVMMKTLARAPVPLKSGPKGSMHETK